MTLYEYKMLTEVEQWEELWESGKHIAKRKYLNGKFFLYALHRFYVEVEIDPVLGTKLGMSPF